MFHDLFVLVVPLVQKISYLFEYKYRMSTLISDSFLYVFIFVFFEKSDARWFVTKISYKYLYDTIIE